jgi:hypothetical protein
MAAASNVTIALRLPGNWAHPGELIERMPRGYRLTPESLVLPDGTEIDFSPLPPDDQFAGIFATSCRNPPTPAELDIVNQYSVNVTLVGPGGSMEAARTMMRAAKAIIEAGAAGVFIDNCALSHGGSDWIAMTDDAGGDALSFAFVSVVDGKSEIWTMGMHTLGLHDIVVDKSDDDNQGDKLIDIIRYMCNSENPIGIGHIIADENGPQYQTFEATPDKFDSDNPMHNPFGRLQLVAVRDIGLNN